MNIPKYKCHKEVQALKIDGVLKSTKSTAEKNGFEVRLIFEGEESIDVPFEWAKKHEPEAGGYYVKYSDGYESFSPAEAFEEGYSLVGEVSDTALQPKIFVTEENLAEKILEIAKKRIDVNSNCDIDEYLRGIIDIVDEVFNEEVPDNLQKQNNRMFFKSELVRLYPSLPLYGSVSDELPAGKEKSFELQPNERPTYQSTSTVTAVKIKTIEYSDDQLTAIITPYESNVDSFTVNQAYIHTQHPGEGGYHVITQEGQHLFHTAEWFEKNFQSSAGKVVGIADMSYQKDAENYRQLENEITEMYEDESNDLVTIGEHVAEHFGFL